ncbi:MAG: hypothetical protein U5K33_04685 [Halofilum sp. (in: g-proteobacteria)]|nr:hypothetical protein [Halofilum sp. (in: g-proteobacteria)]
MCNALFERVDQTVERAGVTDAGAKRVAGFPWLRITRPLTSFRDELDTPARRAAWLERLAGVDAEGRRHELANLPSASRTELAGAWRVAATGTPLPATLEVGLADCRTRLNEALARNPEPMQNLVEAAAPFDEYLVSHRVLGLYPITRHFVLPRIAGHQAARRAAIARTPDAGTAFLRHAVPEPPAVTAPVPADLERDALGIPRPDRVQLSRLFSRNAPVWAVETRSDADLPGALVAADGRPVADTARPAEYRHWSWTRFRGEVLIQLSYVIWFPERPPEDSVDIYAGHLDGLVWRVTLRNDGSPLAYESIHPCGCYYTVFPAAGWRVRPPPGSEPVLAPAVAPEPAPGERVLVRLESRTHYVAGVATTSRTHPRAAALAPLPLSSLRSLPRPDGTRTSAFDADGLIPSSRRPERFLLWPLGVRSPGAMRQWGTHAIAFIGKRHFDDPWLLDRLLEAE